MKFQENKTMIGIIGTGNMGGALILGALKTFGKENVVFYDTVQEKRQEISDKYDILACKTTQNSLGCVIS